MSAAKMRKFVEHQGYETMLRSLRSLRRRVGGEGAEFAKEREQLRAIIAMQSESLNTLVGDRPEGWDADGWFTLDDIAAANEAISASAESVAAWEAEKLTPDAQLCKFYSVSTYQELVAAMEGHILRLQEKIPPMRDTQPGRVREG